MRRPIRTFSIAGAIIALTAAACSSSSSAASSASSGASSSPAVVSTAPGTSAGAATAGTTAVTRANPCAWTKSWGTGAKQFTPSASPTAPPPGHVTAVRVGAHPPCFDRTAIDISGTTPVGYNVRYERPVLSDAKGAPVPVAGKAALALGVAAPNGVHHPPWTVSSPGHVHPMLSPNGQSIVQITYGGGFEGHTLLAVGVTKSGLPFRVGGYRTKTGGYVLYVDVAHPH